jgi:hypothetical protein
MLFDAASGRWAPAGEHDILRVLGTASGPAPAQATARPAPPAEPPYAEPYAESQATVGQQAEARPAPNREARAETTTAVSPVLRWGGIAVAAVIAFVLAGPGPDIAFRMGSSLSILAMGAIPAALAAWAFPRTRPFFPAALVAGVLLVGGLIHLGRQGDVSRNAAADASVDAEMSAIGQFFDQVQDGSVLPAGALPSEAGAADLPWLRRSEPPATAEAPSERSQPEPVGDKARLLRASRLALEDVQAQLRRSGATRGIDIDNPPAEWLEARYLARAAAHPEVPRYFRIYLDYLDETERTTLDLTERRLEARLREQRFSDAVIRREIRGLHAGYAGANHAATFENARRVARSALSLHALLLQIGNRVEYDVASDQALFSVDAELERVQLLIAQIERESTAYLAAMDAARRKMDAMLEEVARRP